MMNEPVVCRAGNTALMIAANSGHESIVRLLLTEYHASVNGRSMYQSPAALISHCKAFI